MEYQVVKRWKTIREERLGRVNELIAVIGSCGRHFFCYRGVVSWLEMDERGRIWFVDSWRGARIYTHYHGRWKGFTGGGTLKCLVESLQHYVIKGTLLSRRHFWWPDWVCGGDLWAYGDDIGLVRSEAERLGLLMAPVRPSGVV